MLVHVFLTLLLISYSDSELKASIFKADSKISHIQQFANTYFIGSTNRIYQVDSTFNILQTLEIGPLGNEDNSVTSLAVSPDPDKPVLLWCGSVEFGACQVNYLSNLNGGNFLDKEYYKDLLKELYFDKNDIRDERQLKLLEHGVYGHLGSRTGAKAIFVDVRSSKVLSKATNSTHLILSSAVYDGRQDKYLPTIGFYSLRKSPHSKDFYIKSSVLNPVRNSFSWIPISPPLLDQYPIYHVTMIENGDYVYTVTVQKDSVADPLESRRFHTRISRFNKTNVKFHTYIEVPITCGTNNHQYNIAMDAKLSKCGKDLYGKLNTTRDGEVLYLLQGEASGMTSYPTVNSAIICAISLDALNNHMDLEMRRCHRGRGSLVEWYYGQERKCESQQIFNPVTKRFEPRATKLVMKGRTLDLHYLVLLPYNATSLYTEVQGSTTVGVIGNSRGIIQKISLASGSIYHTFNQSSGGLPIEREAVVSDGKLLAVSGSRVIAYPLQSCAVYETAELCTFQKDPMECGWCGGEFCSTKEECATRGSTEWYQHAPPPSIHSVSPTDGSISGSTVLTITGKQFTRISGDCASSTFVMLHGTNCTIVDLKFNRIICKSGAVNSEWKGEVIVVRQDVTVGTNKSITTYGHNPGVIFSYMKPEVLELAPSYGPMMGGTTLTVRGKNLRLGNAVQMKVGDKDCSFTRYSEDILTCVTPPNSQSGVMLPVTLLVDGVQQFATNYSYKPNPSLSIRRNRKVHSTLSGGIPVCVSGRNLDSISKYSATVKFLPADEESIPTLLEVCELVTASKVCCPIPDLTPLLTLRKVSEFTTRQAEMTLAFDELTSNMSSVTYHHQPVIYEVTAIKHSSTNEIDVAIKGSGFDHLFYQQLINITLHEETCSVEKKESKIITCRVESGEEQLDGAPAEIVFRYGNFYVKFDDVAVLSSNDASHVVDRESDQLSLTDVLIICSVAAAALAIIISTCVCLVMKTKKKSAIPFNGLVSLTENQEYMRVDQTVGSSSTNPTTTWEEKVRSKGVLIELSKLHVGKEIGSGCFGKVFKGVLDIHQTNGSVTRQLVAIKAVKGHQASEDEVNTFIDEALLMQTFRHEHVLTMLGISFDVYGQPLVVLPFLTHGDLRSYLRSPKNTVSLDDMLGFANDIAMGMNYLEDVLCVHRDLAARNCMLDGNLRVKVADFGLSRDLDNFNNQLYQSTAKSAKLPVKWMSPESLQHRHYSSKSDVWAYGVTLWEIFSKGAYPYADVDNFDILEYIQSGGRLSKPEKCPDLIYNWMLRTWQLNPEMRPNFAQICIELQLCIASRESQASVHCTEPETVPITDIQRPLSFDSGVGKFDIIEEEYLSPLALQEYLIPLPSRTPDSYDLNLV